MVQTPQVPFGHPRRKLWIQFLAFAVIVLLIYLKPKVEAWVESQSKTSTSTDVTSSHNAERPAELDVAVVSPDDHDVSPVGEGTELPVDAASEDAPAPKKETASKTKTASKRKSKKTPPKSTESDKPAEGDAISGSDVADTSAKPPGPSVVNTPANEKSSSEKSRDVASKATGDNREQSVTSSSNPKAPSESTGTSSNKSKDPAATKESNTQKSSTGPSITKMDRPSSQPKQVPGDPEKNIPPPKGKPADDQPELGKLKEIRNNVFESSAGLIYRSGSEDGHRLKHVMQHAKDNLQKKTHGVFDGDGDRDIVLALIDEAFMKAKKGGPDVRSEQQNERLVYTVNLKRRIGQMGGEEGERKGNPECRYLRIVLEDENVVISAYPTRTF